MATDVDESDTLHLIGVFKTEYAFNYTKKLQTMVDNLKKEALLVVESTRSICDKWEKSGFTFAWPHFSEVEIHDTNDHRCFGQLISLWFSRGCRTVDIAIIKFN